MSDTEKINEIETDSFTENEFGNLETEAREAFEWENSYEAHEARDMEEQRIQDEEDEQRFRDTLPPWERTLFPHAEEYAKRGISVIAAKIENGVKKSYVAGKRNGMARWGATTCQSTIFQLWETFPDALIAMPTGSKAEGGGDFIVLDTDTKAGHDVDGEKNREEVLKSVGKSIADLPETVEARTPTGGQHLYFKLPENLGPRKFKKHLAPGVDIQANKQMIIAPPSFRPDKGAPYRWVRSILDFPMAEIPDWLLDLVSKPAEEPTPVTSRKKKSRPSNPNQGSSGITGLDAAAAIQDVCDRLRRVQKGGRNDALNESAFKLGAYVRAGLVDQASVVDELTTAATEIGLEATEIEATIKSGLSAGIEKAKLPGAGNDAISLADVDLSDDALAKEFGHEHFGADSLFCPGQGNWYHWSGTRWCVDELLAIQTHVRSFLKAKADSLHRLALAGVTDPTEAAARSKLAKASTTHLKSMRTITALEKLARSNEGTTISPSAFDADLFLLGTPKGTVDLKIGELRPGRREDLITKSTCVTPSEPGDLPILFLQFLAEIFDGDWEMINWIQRVGGYALTGSTTEHSLFFLYGSGRNGKSVFLNILRHIWGHYARTAPKEIFLATRFEPHSTGLAGLHGARLVIGSEIPRSATWNESTIKDLTGGETVTARFMRCDNFDFDPQFTLMIAGNAKPALAGVDPAMRARIKLVPFEVQIPAEKRDPKLLEKLKLEAPQILRWFIEGAVLWQNDGLKVPRRVAEASSAYLDDEDTIKQFLEERTTRDTKAKTTFPVLFDAYVSWCVGQNLGIPTKREFTLDMENNGLKHRRTNEGNTYHGITLKNS